jgi:hypothetical protein
MTTQKNAAQVAVKAAACANQAAGKPCDVFDCIAAGIPREQWADALAQAEPAPYARGESSLQLQVLHEPNPRTFPLATTPVGKSWEGDPLTNREARRLVNEVRSWAQQFNAPDALALVSAMDDMERLFIRAWTEISEAILCLDLANSPSRTPESAAEMRANAMSYLMRWNTGGNAA